MSTILKTEVLIIGAGPSGISAAIQLKRNKIKTIILEQSKPGGLMLNANLIENYPGFPNGIKGVDLANLFLKQYKDIGGVIDFEKALKVNFNQSINILTNKRIIQTEYLIVASGTTGIKLPVILDSVDTRRRFFTEIDIIKGVSKKRIIILGSGDCAFDYALSLAPRNRIWIVGRSKRYKCLDLLYEKASRIKGIKYLPDTTVEDIQQKNNEIIVTCTDKRILVADLLVFAIGRKPNLEFMGKKNMEENLIPKDMIYYIGDVTNSSNRQVSICVGNGVLAAVKISEILRKKWKSLQKLEEKI
ncbi:MAG: NAD(P)/FAD-dependent oxidoreductase [Candidatus Coatesbacteria bacterium]|nr:NAD(P)/FAD-dependent oxidoreductase [Candidatus Coatesbacteria bacterium]